MKNKKIRWKKIMAWALVIVIVLGVSGLFAVNYAVNKVIDSMADSLVSEIDLEVEGSQEPQTSMDADEHTENTPTKNEPVNSTENPATDTGKTQDNINSNQTNEQEKVTNQDTDEVGVYAPNVTIDKANNIKDKVTVSEKVDVTSILMGSLSLTDIKLFQKMAGGGMTVDEKREARKVLLDKLTPEEYNTLSQIAKKYGVSQGKTYDQAEEEESRVSQ